MGFGKQSWNGIDEKYKIWGQKSVVHTVRGKNQLRKSYP